jgi:trans-2,3-dihydro-3-hydroxyanthranilate isomerase
MVNEIEIYQIDAFTSEIFQGNPAGVVFNNSLNNIEKQLISREMNLSETAFISSSQTANYKLQWFTPLKEVNLCGHATIASLHYLFERDLIADNQVITFETLSGIIKCLISNGKYLMKIPIFQLTNFDGCKEEIINALGIERTESSDLPFILLSNGYLFIHINSLAVLWNLKPDFIELKRLSEVKKEFTDVAVFTTETVEHSSSAHLRFFAPLDGIDEDPVTGSACGPLLLVMMELGLINKYLDDQIIYFEQGDVLNRNGRVGVKFNSLRNELYISGNAITVIKGKLLI